MRCIERGKTNLKVMYNRARFAEDLPFRNHTSTANSPEV